MENKFMKSPVTGRKIEDLRGNVYGYWTVEEVDEDRYRETRKIYWICKCKCGNIGSVSPYDLKNGVSSSCGCYKNEMTSLRNTVDYTNRKIGYLTPLELTDMKVGRANVWKCLCDCGNITYIRSTTLGSGVTTSCGCRKYSKGVIKIKEILDENNMSYETDVYTKIDINQHVFMDFVVNDSYVIEYDGEQHFKLAWGGEKRLERQKELDEMKNNYCLNNDIPIIRIPYTHLNDICLDDLLVETSEYLI